MLEEKVTKGSKHFIDFQNDVTAQIFFWRNEKAMSV